VAGFVYATARNLANNYLRVLHGRPQPEPLGADVAAEDPGEGLERSEQLSRLREGLETLRDLERQILLMTLEGLKPATIASRLGLSCDVVRARKSRAMRKLADSVGFRSHGPPSRVPARSCPFATADRHEKRRRPWRIR
jgi:RNA polymerase sigma factor (sigma-70 family)